MHHCLRRAGPRAAPSGACVGRAGFPRCGNLGPVHRTRTSSLGPGHGDNQRHLGRSAGTKLWGVGPSWRQRQHDFHFRYRNRPGYPTATKKGDCQLVETSLCWILPENESSICVEGRQEERGRKRQKMRETRAGGWRTLFVSFPSSGGGQIRRAGRSRDSQIPSSCPK